jgi:ABC-type uncharacterized transport system substrate-binding protein
MSGGTLTLATILTLALLALPGAPEAQPAQKLHRIGFLALTPAEDVAPTMKAFKDRLRELGYTEGKNLLLEYRSAEGREERLAELASELARSHPDVLVAGFGSLAPLALKRATTTIPVVFTTVGDPVGAGLVTSLARPGGNVTGLSGLGVTGKRLQLLRELVPNLRRVAVLMNPATPFSVSSVREIKAAAEGLRLHVEVLELSTGDQAASRFDAAIKAGAGGMIVVEDPLTYSMREQIIALAAKHSLPTVYGPRDIVEAGGLISYGIDRRDLFRRVADYVDKILKGTKPANLPVEQPTKFEFVLNTRTAKALRLTIPESLMLQADQII